MAYQYGAHLVDWWALAAAYAVVAGLTLNRQQAGRLARLCRRILAAAVAGWILLQSQPIPPCTTDTNCHAVYDVTDPNPY